MPVSIISASYFIHPAKIAYKTKITTKEAKKNVQDSNISPSVPVEAGIHPHFGYFRRLQAEGYYPPQADEVMYTLYKQSTLIHQIR